MSGRDEAREELMVALVAFAEDAYVSGMGHAADVILGMNTRERKRIFAARAKGRKSIRAYYADPANADDEYLVRVLAAVGRMVAP